MISYSKQRTNARNCQFVPIIFSAVLFVFLFGMTSCFDSNTESAPGSVNQKPPAPPTLSCIVQGAWVYDNWTRVDAGGTGVLPGNETFVDYLRCKSCHGWDQLGQVGGYVRRTRTMERANAGFNDSLNMTSRNISTGAFGRHDPITKGLVLHAGSGRSWAEGSAAWDGGSAIGIASGNRHPDFSQTGGLTDQQNECVVAFLNDSNARADQVFSSIHLGTDSVTDPVQYTIVPGASETAGKIFYDANCKTCHGDPLQDSTTTTNNAPGKGGMIGYLQIDGKASEFMHKMHWGITGTVMLREAMGNPASADVANVLQYMQSIISAGLPVAYDDVVTTDTDTAVDIDVLINDRDSNSDTLSISLFDSPSINGGIITKNPDGTLHYVPATGFVGNDEFDYTVVDVDANEASAKVTITVGNLAAANGKIYYNNHCAVCHAAGADDTHAAFNATDLALQASPLVTDLRIYQGPYQLMGAFNSMPPQTLNELEAYFNTL